MIVPCCTPERLELRAVLASASASARGEALTSLVADVGSQDL
jgi:hypothetical protein